jgi:HlyD family secretion protein
MDRIEVQAPVRGIVVKLNYHTRGGVISPGASLMELLPVNDELIIEARVLPNEVIHVKNDLPALVRLSALNQRVTPFIMGRVVYVSADAVSDNDPRRAAMPGAGTHGSFVVRIELDKTDLLSKAHNFVATPGMPAEVFIKTGERTFVQYLLKPLGDSFARAFREQ